MDISFEDGEMEGVTRIAGPFCLKIGNIRVVEGQATVEVVQEKETGLSSLSACQLTLEDGKSATEETKVGNILSPRDWYMIQRDIKDTGNTPDQGLALGMLFGERLTELPVLQAEGAKDGFGGELEIRLPETDERLPLGRIQVRDLFGPEHITHLVREVGAADERH